MSATKRAGAIGGIRRGLGTAQTEIEREQEAAAFIDPLTITAADLPDRVELRGPADGGPAPGLYL